MTKHLPLIFLVLSSLATADAQAQSLVNLLDDASLSHWTQADGKPVTKGWELQDDGTLHRSSKGGHIITAKKYGDFELWFEFRIAKKGNSGIKYRVTNYGKQLLGCEYQILDDSAYPKSDRKNLTASLYDVFEPIPAELRRNDDATTFNVGKIVVRNGRVRHWINGQLTIDECVGSAHWLDAIADSKFANKDNFGQNHYGHIMLTDHGSEVWYRNVYIRAFDCPCSVAR